MLGDRWRVHKFGGTSVADAGCFARARRIVSDSEESDITSAVVVSAMGGKPKTTDLLLDLVREAAKANKAGMHDILSKIRLKHETVLETLQPESRDRIQAVLDRDLSDIRYLLRAVEVMRQADNRLLEVVSGYGEQWSAQILTEIMNLSAPRGSKPWVYVDAREVITVEQVGGVGICWAESLRKLETWFKDHNDGKVGGLVITGFIASTQEGAVTTLGRDGSDYSASIFGRLLGAEEVVIWSDVDGVLSADPRRVPDAYVIPEVSYQEAMELAYFGAKVIHPKTMAPALPGTGGQQLLNGAAAAIPILIKNSFAPEKPGTRITECSHATRSRPEVVCGFSTIDQIALVNVEGSGMMAVPGVATRVFQAILQRNISVTLIAQASSEQSISLALPWAVAEDARDALKAAFRAELDRGDISDIVIVGPCSIIAAVGDALADTPGVSGRFLGALGRAGVSVLAIAQGCSERNISLVVKADESTRALRAGHSAFLSRLPLAVGIIGANDVAASFLARVHESADLQKNFGIDIRSCAILDAKSSKHACCERGDGVLASPSDSGESGDEQSTHKMVLAEMDGVLDLEVWRSTLQERGVPVNFDEFAKRLERSAAPHRIIVDCSDCEESAEKHAAWLQKGIHVISYNMRAVGGDLQKWESVAQMRRRRTSMYSVDVAAGRGLPVLTTLRDMLAAGDEVSSIDGVFSASLSYVLNEVSRLPSGIPENGSGGPKKFSEAVAKAQELGYFERNLDRDLSGDHTAQHLLVIGRELGLGLQREDIKVEPILLPGEKVESLDASLAERVAKARERGAVLRFVGRINVSSGAPSATLGLEEVPFKHVFASLTGAAVAVRFLTRRYRTEPLVLQAPFMNAEGFGEGMFAEVVKMSRELGARGWAPRTLRRAASGILLDADREVRRVPIA